MTSESSFEEERQESNKASGEKTEKQTTTPLFRRRREVALSFPVEAQAAGAAKGMEQRHLRLDSFILKEAMEPFQTYHTLVKVERDCS